MFANLLESDVERLHVLITRHAKLTGSRRAAEILANWKAWLPKFRKVMPVEYRRALREMKAKGLDFSKLFVRQKEEKGQKIYHAEAQNHHLEAVLDRRLIDKAKAALDRGAPVKIEEEINNTDRSAGAMLSGSVAKIYGHGQSEIADAGRIPRRRAIGPAHAGCRL